jgi:hypothetical protein
LFALRLREQLACFVAHQVGSQERDDAYGLLRLGSDVEGALYPGLALAHKAHVHRAQRVRVDLQGWTARLRAQRSLYLQLSCNSGAQRFGFERRR